MFPWTNGVQNLSVEIEEEKSIQKCNRLILPHGSGLGLQVRSSSWVYSSRWEVLFFDRLHKPNLNFEMGGRTGESVGSSGGLHTNRQSHFFVGLSGSCDADSQQVRYSSKVWLVVRKLCQDILGLLRRYKVRIIRVTHFRKACVPGGVIRWLPALPDFAIIMPCPLYKRLLVEIR